jgi:hypothetical protein
VVLGLALALDAEDAEDADDAEATEAALALDALTAEAIETLDKLAADALLTLANDALIGALILDTEVESVLDNGSTAAQRPASGWQPIPQAAAPRPQKPSEPQHAPNVEPWHVKPNLTPHEPSGEMASAALDGVGEAVDEEVEVEDVDPPMGATALQSPKSSWHPVPQKEPVEPQYASSEQQLPQREPLQKKR